MMVRYRFNCTAERADWPSYTLSDIDSMVASVRASLGGRRAAEEHLDREVARERAIRREVAQGMEIDRRVAEERLDAVYRRMQGGSS
jgi:hypothetical protein